MAWLRRSGADTATAPPAPETTPDTPAVIEHPARGLRHALDHLPSSRARALDLGPALAANVELFNRLGARLRIADLERGLREVGLWHETAEPKRWEQGVQALLAAGAGESYDLVLAWDLPNYLGRQRWPAVAALLVERLAPGGILYLLVRTDPTMPARPSYFRWLGAERLGEERHGTATIPPPRFTHFEIERLHHGLAAAHSFLGTLGLQEFLLEHADELRLRPPPQARPSGRYRR